MGLPWRPGPPLRPQCRALWQLLQSREDARNDGLCTESAGGAEAAWSWMRDTCAGSHTHTPGTLPAPQTHLCLDNAKILLALLRLLISWIITVKTLE